MDSMRRKEAMNSHERTDSRSKHWVTLGHHQASHIQITPQVTSKEMVKEKEFIKWYRKIVMEI